MVDFNDKTEDSEQVDIRSQTVTEGIYKDTEGLSRALLVGVGIHGLGRVFGKNIYANLADLYGKFARKAASLAKENRNLLPIYVRESLSRELGVGVSETGAFLKGGARLEDLPLVRDISEGLYLATDPVHYSARESYITKTKEALDRLHRRRPGQEYLHKGLKPLTIGDILDKPSRFLEGPNAVLTPEKTMEFKTLVSGVEKGLVEKNQILDPNIFLDNKNMIVDTRALRPKAFLENTAKIFDPFGAVTALKSFAASPRSIAFLGYNRVSKEPEVFIGGSIYRNIGGRLAESAKDQVLGEVGDSRYVAAMLRENKVIFKAGETKTFAGKVQEAVGIGPRFHERRTGFIQTTKSFFKNLYGVSTGKAHFYARDYKRPRDTLAHTLLDPYILAQPLETGQKLVQGKFFGKGFLTREQTKPTTGFFQGLRGFWNRIKAYTGFSSDISIVDDAAKGRVEAGGRPLWNKDIYGGFERAGLGSLESPIGLTIRPQGVTTLGKLDHTIRPAHYATDASTSRGLYDFANWMTLRLNKLSAASLLGIGFRPSGNLFVNLTKMAAVPATYYMGKEALMYANYLAGTVIGQGPLEYAADAYANARVFQQRIREATGITGFVNKVEKDLFPGIDVGILGTVGAIAAGVLALEGTGSAKKAIGVASAIYGLIGGPQPGQEADSLHREYTGEEKVPVRKNRFWILGYQPFKGGEIDYFKPSWYTEFKQKPYITNVYGSEGEYWKHGSGLPNLHNLFYLNKVIDPYAVERKNYYDRPYPFTGKLFENIPFFGPMLADTLGEIIKPVKRMHEEETSYATVSATLRQPQVPVTSAKELGLPSVPVSLVPIDAPDKLSSRLDRWGNVALEPSGIWKFVLKAFGVKFEEDYRYATASNITSYGRRFYDMQLAGAAGECLIAGSLITTVDGKKPIERIEPGDTVLSKDGEWRKVVQRFEKGISNDLYEIKAATIYSSIIVTGKHRVPVLRRKKGQIEKLDTIDVDAKDILPGDYVISPIYTSVDKIQTIDLALFSERSYSANYVYSRAGDEFIKAYEALEKDPTLSRESLRKLVSDSAGDEALTSFRHRTEPQRFNRYVDIDEEIAWLLGWYSAEGCIDRDRTSFGLNLKEEQVAKQIGQLIVDKFGARSYHIRYITLKGQPTNGIELRVQCIPFALLCAGLCKQRSENKIVPPQILISPKHVARKYLQSILQGDGWCNGVKSGFTSKNAELSRGVFELALRFGAVGNCILDYIEEGNGEYPQGGGRKDTKRSYVQWGTVATEIINIVYKNLSSPIPAPKTCGKSFIAENNLYVKVKSVSRLNKEEYVYDLEVEDLHYYVANQILVHNSELIRRFMLSEHNLPAKINQQINPIQNTIPKWLPGRDSTFPFDKQGYIDFHSGDAFTRIYGGEYRLPGCITPDTYVLTRDGYKYADKITVDDFLLTTDGYQKVWKVFPRNTQEIIYEIDAYSGLPVKVTGDHLILAIKAKQCKYHKSSKSTKSRRPCKPFVVKSFCNDLKCNDFEDYDLKWIPAKNIESGDYVVLPKNNQKNLINKIDILSFCPSNIVQTDDNEFAFKYKDGRLGKRLKFPRYIEVTEDFAYFLGYYIAEGHINESNTVLTAHTNERYIFKYFVEYFKHNFNIDAKIYDKKKYGENAITLSIGSKILSLFIESYIGKVKDKKLPLYFNNINHILAGLFDGDGCNNKEKITLTASKIYKYSHQIANALLLLGTPYSIRERPQRGSTAPTFEISVQNNILPLRYKNNKIQVKNKSCTYIDYKNAILVKVKDIISYEYEGVVYDFGVENVHNYVTSFVMHNSGYEKVNRLHSGVSGVYSDVDRFLVLSDVAPYSAAFKEYEAKVSTMDLSPYWQYKVRQAKDYIKQREEGYQFDDKDSSQDQIRRANESALTKTTREVWTTFRNQALSNIPLIGAKLFPRRDPYQAYMGSVVEGETFADWTAPWETIVRPEFYTTIGQNPFVAAKRGLQLGGLISSQPASFLNPFPIMSAQPLVTTLTGGAIGLVGSLTRMAATGEASHGFIPPHVKKEREVEEYLDKIKYAKYRYLESLAEEQGNEMLANVFKQRYKNTVTYGLERYQSTGDTGSYASALPRTERPFFEAFTRAPKKRQDKILQAVPEHMRGILSDLWERGGSNEYLNEDYSADESAIEYLSSHALPDKEWAGWSPTVPDDAIRTVAVTSGINGISSTYHRLGVYPSHVKEAATRFSFLDPPPKRIRRRTDAGQDLWLSSMMKEEGDNPFKNISTRHVRHRVGPKIDWLSVELEDRRKDSVMAFYQDVYR